MTRERSTSSEAAMRIAREFEAMFRFAHPGKGLDALLVQPVELLRLGADVGRAIERVTPAEWNTFTHELALFEMKWAPVLEVINDVCRIAVARRKRGRMAIAGRRRKRLTTPLAGSEKKGAQQA